MSDKAQAPSADPVPADAAASSRSVLDAPEEIGAAISAVLPEYMAVIEELVGEIHPFMTYLHSSTAGTGLGALSTQATNAFVDIVYDLRHGRGRPALTNVRSLFELLVTTLDIVGSKKLDTRYRDHEWVVLQQQAELTFELELLPTKERSALRHQQKKIKRDYRAKYDEVVARYGSSFARSWAAEDLALRAARHGLEKEYDFYRVASAVLHGSAGGIMGLRAEIESATVFRLGPALSLCPPALLQALRYYGMFVRALRQRGGPAVPELLAKIEEARRRWQEYRRAIMRLDRSIWPDAPPAVPTVIFAFKEGGAFRQWYVHDPLAGQVCEASPPKSLPADLEKTLDELIATVSTMASPSELITVALPGIAPRPRPGAKWQHELVILNKIAPEGVRPVAPDSE